MDQLRTLCVMGTFDNQANQEVHRIKDKLKMHGIATDEYEPHITFGIYTELNDEDLLQWIDKIAKQQKSIKIHLNHFGFFTDARLCFLAPCSSWNLLELHSNIHKRYDECCTDKGCLFSLKQNSWTPHMSIASIDPGQEQKILSILWESFSPFTAEITSLKITSSDMSKAVGVFELNK
ncbi:MULTISPECIES: 2'-5' RNA ligase family protein [unclassified Sedimentibacter]|uniref:2'-5' RNA ligase family protein n=1 Tax=unclassified Sedimentibacter TaxID=2649220 RepID=UPI0027E1223F|nr:2'-5' RNA ligase family protein [Sedimentibacter sp. MB35-C1]WMJ75713.1 2'-5' RNA ligase family protein [Sedimentibacter sp. MB35-C1]